MGKMMMMFCVAASVLLAVLPNLLWFLSWIVAKIFRSGVPYAPFGWTALALVLTFWLTMAYGYHIGRWKLDVTEHELVSDELPSSFDGFRIVHISDLHLATFNDRPDKLQRIVDRINSLQPDLICFTGDFVNMGKEEAHPFTDILRGLSARHGVASVLGNHDFLIYGHHFADEAARTAAVDEIVEYQRDVLGWKVLRNQNFLISSEDGTNMWILGVDNKNSSTQGFRTIDRGDLGKAMEGTGGFRILLSHDPSHWRHEVLGHTSIQLTLSGHTHRAQVQIFGWNPSQLMFTESGGLYHEDGQYLYVNAGLGCTVPFRLGADPEITLLTLRSRL